MIEILKVGLCTILAVLLLVGICCLLIFAPAITLLVCLAAYHYRLNRYAHLCANLWIRR